MVSTSGAELLPRDAVRHLVARLLPRATLLTPNVPEARLLLTETGPHGDVGEEGVRGVEDLERLAGRIRAELGPRWVLLKGGHVPLRAADLTAAAAASDEEEEEEGDLVVVDVLVGPEGATERVQSAFQRSTSTHGTGCSLACKFFLSGVGAVPCRVPCRGGRSTLANPSASGHCGEPLSGQRRARGGARGVPVRRGRHPGGAGAGRGSRAAEPLPLLLRAALFAVRLLPHSLTQDRSAFSNVTFC